MHMRVLTIIIVNVEEVWESNTSQLATVTRHSGEKD